MNTYILLAVQRWARELGLPATFLATLERDAPWVFCGGGLAEELASELLADVFPLFDLGDQEARSFARLLEAFSEEEDFWEVTERLDTSERIVALLKRWEEEGRVTERAIWLSVQSSLSCRPTVHVASGVLPLQELVSNLQSTAKECRYFDALEFKGPSGEELAVIELHPNSG